MSKYSIKERTQIVKLFYENHGSVTLTQRAFRRTFKVRDAPSENTVRSIVRRFEQQGAVEDLPRAGRPRSVTNDEAKEKVKDSVRQNPQTSTRRRSAQLGISRSSLQNILHSLKLFPYKVQLVQSLKPEDHQSRLQYAVELQQLIYDDPNFLGKLMMSDEAHFHLNGFINTQNYRFWGLQNPRMIHQRQLHSKKCTVWCAISSNEIIGPYFFEDENGNAVTVTGARYRAMIENFLLPRIQDRTQVWFQQDGATPHTAKETMNLLKKFFGERVISRNSNFNWPPRSPDLSSPDFFLWGYLKEKVYINQPRDIPELKDNIITEIRDLNRNQEILQSVMEHVLERAQICEAENGAHLKDVVFQT